MGQHIPCYDTARQQMGASMAKLIKRGVEEHVGVSAGRHSVYEPRMRMTDDYELRLSMQNGKIQPIIMSEAEMLSLVEDFFEARRHINRGK